MSDKPVQIDDDRMIVTLTVGELRALICEEIGGALKRYADGISVRTTRWMDIQMAAKQYGCTTQTIRNWIRQGAPAVSIGGGMIRLDIAAFEAWVRAQKPRR